MGKYSIDKLIHGYGDHDLESKYQGTATVIFLEKIANELAESNRLKRATLELEIIKLVDPALVVDFKFKKEDLA